MARKCGCRMMHMPGKELGRGAKAGGGGVRPSWGQGARSLGTAPERPPPPPPQAGRRCAAPSNSRTARTRRWVRGRPPPHPRPCSALATGPAGQPGGPDSGDCGPQTPCCGRTRAPAPTPAPARATPRSSPWCGSRAAPPPATWPGNTTAARPTSRERGQPGWGGAVGGWGWHPRAGR